MTTLIQAESTEFLFIGVNGDVPSVGAEVAFLAPAVRPIEADWETATLVTVDTDPLWADALASGVTGDYFVAILVGSFGGNTVAPAAGDYAVWMRLTGATEQPVRIAPEALEVQG